jgi:hypothetical protein
MALRKRVAATVVPTAAVSAVLARAIRPDYRGDAWPDWWVPSFRRFPGATEEEPLLSSRLLAHLMRRFGRLRLGLIMLSEIKRHELGRWFRRIQRERIWLGYF